jgi:dynein heavy chain 2
MTFSAVAWVQSNGELVVPWSLVGIVRTGLSQMHGVTSRSHFTCALIRGLGTNLSETSRQAFAEKVMNNHF